MLAEAPQDVPANLRIREALAATLQARFCRCGLKVSVRSKLDAEVGGIVFVGQQLAFSDDVHAFGDGPRGCSGGRRPNS